MSNLEEIRLVRPEFYPKQFEAIYDPRRISVIEASTKSGKTSSCIAWLIEQALKGRKGWNYWWIAPVTEQAAIAFRRMQMSLPRDFYVAALSHPQHITLGNGAVIWFRSADKPNSLYGEDVYAAVVDEASRMKEEAWIALRSTLTYTRGPVRIIGNVRGRRNWAFQLARMAERGDDPDIGYHKLIAKDAVDAGVLDAKEVEAAKRTMPDWAWRELYLAEPSDDGGNPFGLQHIKACIAPLSAKKPQWWGWDLAKSVDWTVGIGLDEDGHACRIERFQHIPWGEIRNRIVTFTGAASALVDSSGVGDPVVEELKRTPGTRFEGYKFTATSKQQLMEGLAVAIQSRTVTFPEGVVVNELEQFEYEAKGGSIRYAAPEGFYDDCVCALALAVMCRAIVPAKIAITPDLMHRLAAMPRRRQH